MTFRASVSEIVAQDENGLLGAHPSWCRVPLTEVAKIQNGFPFPSKQFTRGEGMPLLRIRDVLNTSTEAFFNGEFDTGFVVYAGDLVIGMDGDFTAAIWKGPPALLNQRVCRVTPNQTYYDRKLLAFVLPGYLNAINAATSSLTVKHLSSLTIAEIPLPLPPRIEQRRIVAEIEKQFTRLEAAVAALKRIQANLKRYRAAVLKAAVEGRLVPTQAELARAEGRSYEPADQLLQRILAERRTRWEADQLAKFRASGKEPTDQDWKSNYKEPTTPDESALPKLPEGWTWATLSQLSEIQGGIQKQPSRRPAQNPHPFLRVANVLRGRLDLSEVHKIELFKGELEKLRLEARDLLIVEGNGSPSEIGRMAIWKGEIENCVHQNHIIRARLLGAIPPAYVAAYWNSPEGASRVLDVASSTSGLYTLSVGKVGRLPVPLPPLAEQQRVVAEAERRLSVIDELEMQVEANLKRAERLRQAILKRAFEGKLVPQDPDDEPASALLERIRAARSTGLQPVQRKQKEKRTG